MYSGAKKSVVVGCFLGIDPGSPPRSFLDVQFDLASWADHCSPERVCGWRLGPQGIDTVGSAGRHRVMRPRQEPRAGEERVPMVIIQIGDNEME